MARRPERSVQELYRDDPERADAVAFGRRGALKGAALAAMGGAVGAAIPFAGSMPGGTLPALFARPAAAQDTPVLRMDGKGPLILQGDRPLNAETPETLLDEPVTSAQNMFIRNNGGVPDAPADPRAWKITFDGEVNTPLELTVGELESRFEVVTRQLQLECGGNGRSFYAPQTRGNQWGNGAVSNGEWTGVRLRDVLRAAGLKPSAVATGHYGADPHLSGEPGAAFHRAGHGDRQGDGRGHADRLPAERAADSAAARRAGAAGDAGLAGQPQPEMADAGVGARQAA
jgi:sulfite oxidase